ncbi:hypothetical protein L6164_023826 [Bauhinia variegata]|uniref:Uncharacterized protein n=1 Tax=Bauhinia variegata TaxID=167791 RepID=A0ACB9MKU7_BAUVA|nr:hypothetical protein L6164_023826 [Bauhinia variegata]
MKDASSAVPSSGVRITPIDDFNADASSPTSGSKSISTNNPKRKESVETIEGERSVPKKPRMVWTNELHNRFLRAIRQVGQDRASPKKIYEIMKVPGLTRKHVASHLQKYRLFLKKVDELLSLEGAPGGNILSSKLAKGLSDEVIKEIQKRIELIRQLSGSRTTTLNPSNTSQIVLHTSSNASIAQVLSTQLSNPSSQGVSFQNQHQDPRGNYLRLAGQSLFASKIPANSFQKPILGGFPSLPYYPYNGGSNFSSYSGSIGSYDSINAANAGLIDVNHGGFAAVDSSEVFSPVFSSNTTQQENFSSLPPSCPHLGDPGNAADQSQSTSNTSGDSQPNQFDKELTELFFLMDSISIIDEPQEPSNVIVPPNETIVNLPNELLTPPNENPNQLKGGNESTDSDAVGKYMVEDAIQPSNYANYNDQASHLVKLDLSFMMMGSMT